MPDWLKVIKLPPRFLFAIGLLGLIMLFLPDSAAKRFGIDAARAAMHPWLGIGTLAALVLWLVQLIPAYNRRRERKEFEQEQIDSLDSLSVGEWVIFAYCLKQHQQTITLSLIDKHGGTLVARGLLIRAAGIADKTAWPHTIPRYIWRHLNSNRTMFLASHGLPSDTAAESMIAGLHEHIIRQRI